MKGKKRKSADEPKESKPKQPKPKPRKPKGKPNKLGWVGPVSPAATDPSSSSPEADPSDSSSSNKRQHADIGSGLADERVFQFDPATQMGMGLDPGAIQAVSAASGVWDEDGCLDSFIRSKLTRSQHLAAATPAGTSLVANQRHVAVTLATWDAVWEEYLHPKWAEQRMRLHGAQEKVLERYFKKLEKEAAVESQKRWGTRKQLVVFFGNARIGTRGGWGAKAVLQACRKVVERANSGKSTDRMPGKVVTVDQQAWSKRFETPVRGLMWCPQLHQDAPGDLSKWGALNMQRAGESKWRPLELCRWQHRGAAPAKGREYPALGCKVLRDRAPKALAQQPEAK
ncbi:hypothetical protein QJQ45_002105 [Haematococcus lacustris]|nr:hypothetical protein QJQ45_002105 [Haematococcus lacustris]